MSKGEHLMKPALSFIAIVAVLAAGAFGVSRLFASSGPSSASASPAKTSKPCAPGALAQYGHIESVALKGDHYELRFDPALFTSGVTASRAMLEDTGSSDVPNDNYVIEEGHRLLTYLVPKDAYITVLSRTGTIPGAGFPSTRITPSQLAQLVSGKTPVELAESLDSGFWMHYRIDTVCSLEQQYMP
jgi:hypothetical protein